MKIYTYPNNPRVWKAQIAGKYVGVEIETPAFEMGKDNKSTEFLAKFPAGKVRYKSKIYAISQQTLILSHRFQPWRLTMALSLRAMPSPAMVRLWRRYSFFLFAHNNEIITHSYSQPVARHEGSKIYGSNAYEAVRYNFYIFMNSHLIFLIFFNFRFFSP